MRAAVRGIGVVGGFGCGLEKMLAALDAGSAPAVEARFPAERREVVLSRLAADTSELEMFVEKRLLRRTDHLSRLALLGAHLALRDAGYTAQGETLGVALGTGYGATRTTFAFLDSFLRDGDTGSSPTLFSSSVHNAPAATVSMLLGITGPNLTVSQFGLSFPSALLTALGWLEEGRCQAVLVGGLDEWCDMLGYCWWRFFGEEEGPMEPLDFGRQTAVPGEGAAVLLLTGPDGPPPRHGWIEEVRVGHRREEPLDLPEGALLVLGADGQRICGDEYEETFPRRAGALAWAACWGSLPAGMAFDTAAAAAVVGRGRLPGRSPGSLGGRPLVVARAGAGGGYALVTVRR